MKNNTQKPEAQQLIPLESVTAADLFGGADENKLNDLLAGIKDTATSMAAGLTVIDKQGRDEIASIAYKVARSKTTIDNAGKEFVSDLKAQAKAVDERRRAVREQLDALRDDIRRPLNEYEEREKNRVEKIQQTIASIEELSTLPHDATVGQLSAQKSALESIGIDDLDEHEDRARALLAEGIEKLSNAIIKRRKYDEDQAELERLRVEKQQREQADRDEQIRKDAAAQAKREAEQEAQAKADKEELERIAEENAAKAREKDRAHRARVNSAAVDALVKHGVNKTNAKAAITAIAKGLIPAVKISY